MSFRRFAPIVALLGVMIALIFANPSTASADDPSAQPLPMVCTHQIGPGQAYGPAGGAFIDPIRQICSIATTWIQPAKDIAMNLLTGLLVIEFFFVGVQTGLFKNDLSELLGTVTFKVFVSCLMIWLIGHADSFLYGIVEGFEYAGRNVTGFEGREGTEIGSVVGFFLSAGVILASRAGALQSGDLALAGSPLTSTPGGAAYATVLAQQHNQHAAIIGFLALVLLVSAGTILLQYFLITAESFIVIFGGIVFLGFAGSRFTMPFAQGYMSYAVNLGARFFAFYLVMSIEFSLVQSLTLASAQSLAPLGTGLPGVPAYPVLAQCAGYVLQTAILASLCWFIPNLAGSFMTGGSAFSAQSVMGNLSGMAAGIQSMIANNQAVKSASADQQRMSGNAAALNSAQPSSGAVHAGGDDAMAPAVSGSLGGSSLSGSSGEGTELGSSSAGGDLGSASAASGTARGGAGVSTASVGGSGGAGAARPIGGSVETGAVSRSGGALQAHAVASSPEGGLSSGQSAGGDGGSTGGAPSPADDDAAEQAGTSLGGLSKSQMGAVSGAQASDAAVSGNLAGIGSSNLSGLQPAAVDSARQALSAAQQDTAIREDYDKAQEAAGIRSAMPTGEAPPSAVQARFGLGER